MKKHLPTWLRTLASTVATVYFFSNVVLAYTPEKNLWAERRRHIEKSSANQTEQQDNLLLASLPASSPTALFQSLPSTARVTSALSDELAKTLPLSVTAAHAKLFNSLQTTHGTIRKVWLPTKNAGDRVVVHIQDVHQNQDAQRHIGGAIESLLSSGQAGVVGLEGAFAPIDVKAYHDYKNREVIRLTADYLLKENLITGPVHTAMTTPAPLAPLVGVDDATHYNANVEAYRQSAPKVDTYKKAWTAKKFALAQEKKKVFSPALLAFDAQVEGYHSRGDGLEDYVNALSPVKGQGPAGLLAQAFEMENALDFNRVEADRKNLIDALVKTLTQDQINHLVQESTAYRVGQVRYAEFYVYLKDLCRGAKVDLAKYPHMDAYIRYVMLSDRIDGEKLLTELATLEKSRYAALVKTEQEKNLVARSRALTLAGRLITFELSPEEWADYVKNNAGESLGLDMAGFEAFYKEAHARDESLTVNLLKAMEDGHHKTAVLVTGGYHTDGVSERLTQAGVTVVTFTPRVETLDTESGSTYLSIFTQEKTPLEKLFAGEKLFLGQDPIAESTEKMTAPAVAAGTSALAGESPTESRSLFGLLGGQYKKIEIAVKAGGATVKVWGKEAATAVKVMVSQTPEGLSVQQTVVVGLSVASIAFFLSPFVAPLFTAISTAVVSLTGLMPGMTLLTTGTTTFISQLMGQSGHAVVAFLGIPVPTALDISSAVAITTNIFAASFLILMASSIGNKFVVFQGGKRGATPFPVKSEKEKKNGLTLIQNEGQDPPQEDNKDDKYDPKPVVVEVTDGGIPLFDYSQPKKTDFGFPTGPKIYIFLGLSFGLSLLLGFLQPAIAATGAANYLGFGWDQPLLWGVAISGLVVVTMLSFAVIHLLINATKLDQIRDFGYVRALFEMNGAQVPKSVFDTLTNAPAGKEVAVISLLNTGSEVSQTEPHLFIPVVERTEAINQFQSVTGRRNPRTARQSIQYVDDANLVEKELEHMKGFQTNSLGGIIRFPVINENPDRFNDSRLAQNFMIEANRALVKGGILQFWVPYKIDYNAEGEDQSIKRTEMLKQLLIDNGFTDIEIKETKSMGTEFKAVKNGSPSIFDRFKSFTTKSSFMIIAIAASFLFASTPSPAAPVVSGGESITAVSPESRVVEPRSTLLNGSFPGKDSMVGHGNEVILNGGSFRGGERKSRQRLDKMNPQEDAREFIAAIHDPASLLNAVTPMTTTVTGFNGVQREAFFVDQAPNFVQNMAFWGYQSKDPAYLKAFNEAITAELVQDPKLKGNMQVLTILSTLLGGVTAGPPLTGEVGQLTVFEATVNNQGALDTLLHTAEVIHAANTLIVAQGGKGIRLILTPSEYVSADRIRENLAMKNVDPSLFAIKADPADGKTYTLNEYVEASRITLAEFTNTPESVNFHYLNMPNINDITQKALSDMQEEGDALKKLLAKSLLAWMTEGDRYFSISTFNSMFEAAILASQSA